MYLGIVEPKDSDTLSDTSGNDHDKDNCDSQVRNFVTPFSGL